MSENTVVITENDGNYHITNNGIPEFTLLGILECIVFEMKTVKLQSSSSREVITNGEQEPAKKAEPQSAASKSAVSEPITSKSNAPELRTRISNAVKAIKNLGGDAPAFDADAATDEQLQEELAALTEQYKRLKNSK